MLDDEDKKWLKAFALGGLFGIIGTVLVTKEACAPFVDEARTFREEGKPTVMRLYKHGSNGYLVQDPQNPQHYIPLSQFKENVSEECKQRTERIEATK